MHRGKRERRKSAEGAGERVCLELEWGIYRMLNLRLKNRALSLIDFKHGRASSVVAICVGFLVIVNFLYCTPEGQFCVSLLY